MTAKELERLIAERGGNATALDTVTRALRKAMHVSTAGRGFNAHRLSNSEIVWVLFAYAGAEAASRAAEAVLRVAHLVRPESVSRSGAFFSNSFQAAVQEALGNPRILAQVKQVRIAKNFDFATIVLNDGYEIHYCGQAKSLDAAIKLASESVLIETALSGGLLADIAVAMGDRG